MLELLITPTNVEHLQIIHSDVCTNMFQQCPLFELIYDLSSLNTLQRKYDEIIEYVSGATPNALIHWISHVKRDNAISNFPFEES